MSMWGQQAEQMWGQQPEDPRTLGQTEGDHERIFPRFTVASAASSGEVTINGKVVRIWEYSQLEPLAIPILRQRAMVIRDALGDSCPPLPSAQRNDLIQWILHMQSQLTNKDVAVGRQGAGVPDSFMKDSMARPISGKLQEGRRSDNAPFGPRSIRGPNPTRDHYGDMLAQKNEFSEVRSMGIQSMRDGGEGRKFLAPRDSMLSQGVSDVDRQGVQTLKPGSEGRRYLTCDDNISFQKKQNEAVIKGERQPEVYNVGMESIRTGGEGMRHVLARDSMTDLGTSAPEREPHIGGERKKHISPVDHMVNNGVGDDPRVGEFGPSGSAARPLRKQMQTFSGANQSFKGTDDSYRRSWKKDPSRLQGTSLII